jgi:hypothetical protein
MPDNAPDQKQAELRAAVARLAKETGITEAEARQLIDLLGMNW